MAGRFAGQVAWITGGGSGIGRAMALELGREGARVAVSGRREDRLAEVVAELEGLGATGLAVRCDVTDEPDVERAVATVVGELGSLDVAIANAGFAVANPIEKLTADDWRRQLDTNVVGLAVTVRHALPHLRKSGGRIALVGSISSLVTVPNLGAYSASKYAVRAIGQTLSVELAGSGVSCTTLHPGFVQSEINRVDNQGRFDPDRAQRPNRLKWPAERAARICVRAIHRRKRELVFTGHGRFAALLGRHTPGITHLVLSRGVKKKRRRQLRAGD